MRAEAIPFSKLVGIQQSEEGVFLPYTKELTNHLETLHAGAQFSLAETASGLYLQECFPELVGKVIPILRESKIKYKKPVVTTITALVKIDDTKQERFLEQFFKKGRALLEVNVEVVDTDKSIVASASFIWFIQAL